MIELATGTIKRIHVNMHVMRHNTKTGERCAILTIQHKNRSTRAQQIDILGPSRVVYAPDAPLSCGARAWIETMSAVIYEEADDAYQHAKSCKSV